MGQFKQLKQTHKITTSCPWHTLTLVVSVVLHHAHYFITKNSCYMSIIRWILGRWETRWNLYSQYTVIVRCFVTIIVGLSDTCPCPKEILWKGSGQRHCPPYTVRRSAHYLALDLPATSLSTCITIGRPLKPFCMPGRFLFYRPNT